MVVREGGQQLCNDLALSGCGTSPGGKQRLIRGVGSAARISNGTRPQDPGGGEVQLTPSRDMAVTRPMIQPTLQSGGLWSGEVRVSAVSVDADWKQVNQTVSTIPDCMDVNVSQRDSRTQLRSGLPQWGVGGGGCGQCGWWCLCGRRVGLCVPE